MAWPKGYQPYGPNHSPLLTGLSATDAKTPIPVAVDPATGEILTGTETIGLVPQAYDYISIPSYDGNNNPLTVIYKVGGSGGTTVATLTLTYSGSNIATVTRT